MTSQRHQDPRDEVDRIVHRHQLEYSIGQLRLVGLLLLAVVLGTLLVAAGFGSVATPLARLKGLLALTPTLPLLPLGVCLYLLGGGHRRHRHEQGWAPALHRALLPMALLCLLVLPALTLHAAFHLHSRQPQTAEAREILSPAPLLTTLLVQGLTGGGLLLQRRQGRRQMQRMGLTPGLFFRTDATGPVRRPAGAAIRRST
ncbi:MAG: hypothetical protein ER33_11900 [Cyanobium sp. CACIAM 14]|nr:MAG: hypothetical protein ER33_11900 [Cyanobium sp. CACIAM 14]